MLRMTVLNNLFKLCGDESKELEYLYLLRTEFDELRKIIFVLSKFDSSEIKSVDPEIIHNSLNIDVVISYARNFTQSKGFGKIKKIQKKLLKEYDKNEKDLHKKIYNLRNKEFAHSDNTNHDIRIENDEMFEFSKKPVREHLSSEDVDLLRNMTKKLIDKVQSLINKYQKENPTSD